MGKLARLFIEMFKVALFVVGGGFAIIAVCDEVFSRKLRWTEEGELLDMLPLYQMMPGILAAHNAVYVGRKVAGPVGSLVALAGVALPSIIIFTAVSMGYDFIPLHNPWLESAFVGLRSALAGVIIAMLAKTWRKSVSGVRAYAVFVLAAIALATPGVPAVAVILAAVVCGVASGFAGAGASKAFQSSPLAALLFLQYGAVAFGGGYVLVPVYIQDFVGEGAKYLQIAPSEFANLMALTQMTPGPIGLNAATYFGYRLFGVTGGLVATACILLPGFVAMSLALASLERFRESAVLKGVMAWVRPVTAALMSSAAIAFVGMSCYDVTDAPHVSWCTFGPFNVNAVAVAMVAAAALAVGLRRLGVMSVIAAGALTGLAFRV